MRFPLAVALAFFAHPLWAQQAVETTTEPPAGTIAVGSEVSDDAAIRDRIDAIRRELDGLADVTVAVSSGVVSLAGTAADAEAAAELAALAARVDGVVAVENDVAAAAAIDERLDPAVSRLRARAEAAVAYFPLLLVALAAAALVTAAGFLLARSGVWRRLAPNAFLADIYAQILRVLALLAGLVLALDILGASALLGTILGAAGIVGLAIGFAVRDTVENFIASVMLSLRQPFQPNDLVEIEGDMGKVIRLTSRATILMSLDGNHVRIPNATVFKSRIVNFSRNPQLRFLFDIGVEADSDLGAVRAMIENTVAGLDFVLEDPAPAVWIEALNETGAVMRVTGWIDQGRTQLMRGRSAALLAVKQAIEASGVAIPDTTYRIRLEGGGEPAHRAPERHGTPPPERPQPGPAATPATDEPVEPRTEAALDRLIRAERAATAERDLLTRGGAEE